MSWLHRLIILIISISAKCSDQSILFQPLSSDDGLCEVDLVWFECARQWGGAFIVKSKTAGGQSLQKRQMVKYTTTDCQETFMMCECWCETCSCLTGSFTALLPAALVIWAEKLKPQEEILMNGSFKCELEFHISIILHYELPMYCM